MSKKIFITGASSYVGSNLVKACLNAGYELGILVRETSDLNLLGENSTKVKIYKSDGSFASINLAISDFKPEVVVHLASWFIVDYNSEQIDELINSNITLGTHILEAMSKSGCKNFINTGTYWQHNETDDYQPNCLYAATRQAFCNIVDYFCLSHQINAITLKLYDVYGPNDPRKKIFWLLKDAAENSKTLSMTEGNQKLCPVFLDDTINAYLAAIEQIESSGSGHQTYYVGGETRTLKDIVNSYIKISRKEIDVKWGAVDYRKNQIMNPYIGPSLPGWKQEISLEDGIKKILN